MSFGRYTKSRWSLLPGVYARGSKISHTGGKCVTCHGLKEWWPLSLTHKFPARERHRAALTTLLRSPVLDRKTKKKNFTAQFILRLCLIYSRTLLFVCTQCTSFFPLLRTPFSHDGSLILLLTYLSCLLHSVRHSVMITRSFIKASTCLAVYSLLDMLTFTFYARHILPTMSPPLPANDMLTACVEIGFLLCVLFGQL